jgi:hypothetical protein
MTLPAEDDRLVNFLRRHRPVPPAAPPELEDQIMAALEPPALAVPTARGDRRRYQGWTIPALAASALLAWGGWVTLRSPQQPSTELAQVEDYLTETWYGSAYGDDTLRLTLDTTQPDWLLSVYATPY